MNGIPMTTLKNAWHKIGINLCANEVDVEVSSSVIELDYDRMASLYSTEEDAVKSFIENDQEDRGHEILDDNEIVEVIRNDKKTRDPEDSDDIGINYGK